MHSLELGSRVGLAGELSPNDRVFGESTHPELRSACCPALTPFPADSSTTRHGSEGLVRLSSLCYRDESP